MFVLLFQCFTNLLVKCIFSFTLIAEWIVELHEDQFSGRPAIIVHPSDMHSKLLKACHSAESFNSFSESSNMLDICWSNRTTMK